jgi:hypothetical protein
MGGAWLTGGLEAIARETGWDPATADYIVGTSAGSMIGSLCAAGVPPWFMVAHSAGEVFEGLVGADGRPAAEADRAAGETEADRGDVSSTCHRGTGQRELHTVAAATRRIDEDGRRLMGRYGLGGCCAFR